MEIAITVNTRPAITILLTLCVLWCLDFIAGDPATTFAQPDNGAYESEATDSTEASVDKRPPEQRKGAFPKKEPSHRSWEKVAAIPGKTLYVPIWVLFRATGLVIAANAEYDILPRMVDLLTSDDGRRGVYPTYSSRGGIGAKYFADDILNEGSRFTATATAGLRKRFRFDLYYKRVALFGGALASDYRLEYRRFSDEKFFGVGPDSRKEDETNYLRKQARGAIALGTWSGSHTEVGLALGYEHNIVGRGGDDRTTSTTDSFSEETLPGLEEESSMGRAQFGLRHDTTNRRVRPSSGVEANVVAGIHGELVDEDFGFTEVSADARVYFHWFRDRIFVFRLAGRFADPLGGREVPFYHLSALGRFETIRGFTRGRFRDRDMVLGSIEYRYPVRRKVDALLFVDTGQVAGDMFRDFTADHLRWTFGGGFRAWHRRGTLLRLEIGFSDDGFRIHFGLN
ncbi:MAG: BamA/TamA family outer membrane protein [Candidatus Latescibacterota bacterium]|nr:MAG: BamA/TamA family outer membrane protein [Candidatus Latescibacterota bacterium]